MARIKITQIKSLIDRSQKQKDTLLALGLGRINKSRILENNAQVQGMINKVAHLVQVEQVG